MSKVLPDHFGKPFASRTAPVPTPWSVLTRTTPPRSRSNPSVHRSLLRKISFPNQCIMMDAANAASFLFQRSKHGKTHPGS